MRLAVISGDLERVYVYFDAINFTKASNLAVQLVERLQQPGLAQRLK